MFKTTTMEQSFVNFDIMGMIPKSVRIESLDALKALLKASSSDIKKIESEFNDKHLENWDLSNVEFPNGMNFDKWKIENVAFSRLRDDTEEKKTIFGLSFRGACLKDVSFVQSKLVGCNFDSLPSQDETVEGKSEKRESDDEGKSSSDIKKVIPQFEEFYNVQWPPPFFSKLEGVDFFLSELDSCRFRNAYVMASDFRYSHIKDCCMSEGNFYACDFYCCSFKDATTFVDSRFILCSFTNSVFENYCIRLKNICDNEILQDDKDAYDYIVKKYPRWKRYNQCFSFSHYHTDKKSSKLDLKKESAEFYKQMSGIYAGKGLNRDSNRAYMKSKNKEICIHFHSIWKGWTKIAVSIWNFIKFLFCDLKTPLLGYGFSWLAPILWFIALVLIYGTIYYYQTSINQVNFGEALWESFKNSLSPSCKIAASVGPIWAGIQTALGILLMGFLGFIFANKIRNDS